MTSPSTPRAPSSFSTAERRLALLEGMTTDLAGSLCEEEIAQRVVGYLHDMLGAA